MQQRSSITVARDALHNVCRGQYRASLRLILALMLLGAGAGALGVIVPGLATASIIFLGVSILAVCAIVAFISSRLNGRLEDVGAAVSMGRTLDHMGWQPALFFTDGAAGTPALQLLILKVVTQVCPAAVLELGSGQTTKLLALYQRDHPEADVVTLEESAAWIEHMRPVLAAGAEKHRYVFAPKTEVVLSADTSGISGRTLWYDVPADILARQYELILVDGPAESEKEYYSRAGLLPHLPAILAPRFVLIFDDAERAGEARTIAACSSLLRARGRRFLQFQVHGVKTHHVFCSPEFGWLRSV